MDPYKPLVLPKEEIPNTYVSPFTEEEYQTIRKEMILIQAGASKQPREQIKKIKRLYNKMEQHLTLRRQMHTLKEKKNNSK